MKKKLKYWYGLIITFSLVVGLLAGSASRVYAADPNPVIRSPDTKVQGMTYGEWSAAWWKWAYSIPAAMNPLNDGPDCANGSVGQFGPVWFLGGAWSPTKIKGQFVAKVVRNCTVPNGKTLFFPIVNSECSTLEGDGNSYDVLLACAKGLIDLATNLGATIDGIQIQNLNTYRAESPPFTFGPLPDGSLLQQAGIQGAVAGASSLAAADGYYLMVAPLSNGPHQIHFSASVPTYKFSIDITYNLAVGSQ